jgi:hypothetical protein
MQYFCIEIDNCGFYERCKKLDKYPDQICPVCFSPLLKYPDGKIPSWLKVKTTIQAPIEENNDESEAS